MSETKPDDLTKTEKANIELTEDELGHVSGGLSDFQIQKITDKTSPLQKVKTKTHSSGERNVRRYCG